ncbi:MAG: hypothetical protein IPL97_08185 [Niastella sp.]|nr:hypothetical protein [Niastella sp.]
MKEKYNISTNQRPDGDRPLDATLVQIDLPQFIHQIKDEVAWKESDRNAITVYKTNGLRMVLVALHQDAELTRHIAKGIISIQLISGCILFTTDQQSVELKDGQILALHERIPHSVRAVKESVFLLTLTTSLEV